MTLPTLRGETLGVVCVRPAGWQGSRQHTSWFAAASFCRCCCIWLCPRAIFDNNGLRRNSSFVSTACGSVVETSCTCVLRPACLPACIGPPFNSQRDVPTALSFAVMPLAAHCRFRCRSRSPQTPAQPQQTVSLLGVCCRGFELSFLNLFCLTD